MRINNSVLLGLLFSSVLMTSTALQADGGVLDINWDEVPTAETSVNQLSLLKTSPRLRSPAALARLTERLSGVKLPVYLPKAELNYSETLVIAEENFYDISVEADNATIMISGDRYYHQKLNNTTEHLVTTAETEAKEATFNIAEGIAEANFNRFGANYSLSVECAEPYADKRCTELDFIREVYDTLVLVRGK